MAAILPVTMFYSANTMVRDVIQHNLMCTIVCLLTQYLPERVGRQGNPAWEESGAVQDKLVSIQEKGRIDMMHQDSCAEHMLLLCSLSRATKPTGCTFLTVHSPADQHQST